EDELPEFDAEKVARAVEGRTGWFVGDPRVELRGLCPDCQ
ncbi:MAG TPA: transcriptional repressor, partial [Oceanithermus profundus]|nr:transcriptional repressor [Oceanithermus profundus]